MKKLYSFTMAQSPFHKTGEYLVSFITEGEKRAYHEVKSYEEACELALKVIAEHYMPLMNEKMNELNETDCCKDSNGCLEFGVPV